MERKLSRKLNARRALLRNLASSLVIYEAMTTTKSKARALKPLIERYLTAAKRKTLVDYRYLRGHLSNLAAKKMYENISARIERKSGNVRIVNLGLRKGDAAPLVRVELLIRSPIKIKPAPSAPASKPATADKKSHPSARKKEKDA